METQVQNLKNHGENMKREEEKKMVFKSWELLISLDMLICTEDDLILQSQISGGIP